MINICVVTSTRADYGILQPLMKALIDDKRFLTRICVTGTHLSDKYGKTIEHIDIDKSNIDCIDILGKGLKQESIFSETIVRFDEYLEKNKFDYIVVLGDRYEILGVAITAYMKQIKVIHIHGGEKTLGLQDEGFRHSITKFSSLHFTSTEEYRKRVIQLGENPCTVYNVGSLSVESILNMKFKTKNELICKYGLQDDNICMVTFNPVTLKKDKGVTEIEALLESCSHFDFYYIFMFPNIDTGADDIFEIIRKNGLKKYKLLGSIPYDDYISLAKNSSLFIGNSSSGIIEIPSLHIPVINIGDRQLGRLKSELVIDSKPTTDDICSAIKKSMSSEYREKMLNLPNPYQKENTVKEIIETIYSFNPKDYKEFYDIK